MSGSQWIRVPVITLLIACASCSSETSGESRDLSNEALMERLDALGSKASASSVERELRLMTREAGTDQIHDWFLSLRHSPKQGQRLFELRMRMAEEALLFRLAEIRTNHSAAVIVSLVENDELSWDGERGLLVGHLITSMGELVDGPLRRAIAQGGPRVGFLGQLLDCVEKGQVYR